MKKHLICLVTGLSVVLCARAGVVQDSGVTGGIVVRIGCDSGQELTDLRVNEKYLVQGLETDKGKIGAVREYLRSKDLYGPVSVSEFDGKTLPYVDNLVNLVVADASTSVPKEEIMRVLAPLGVAIIGGTKSVKPWPREFEEWTHYLHGADNSAVANDTVVAAPKSIQWVSYPKWARSHEEIASMSAAVTNKAGRGPQPKLPGPSRFRSRPRPRSKVSSPRSQVKWVRRVYVRKCELSVAIPLEILAAFSRRWRASSAEM